MRRQMVTTMYNNACHLFSAEAPSAVHANNRTERGMLTLFVFIDITHMGDNCSNLFYAFNAKRNELSGTVTPQFVAQDVQKLIVHLDESSINGAVLYWHALLYRHIIRLILVFTHTHRQIHVS